MEDFKIFWDNLRSTISDDFLFISVSIALHFFFYWSLSLALRHLDLYHYPKFLYKLKWQPKQQVTKEEYNEIFICAITQQLLVGVPFYYVGKYFFNSLGFELNYSSNFPSITKIIFDIILILFFEDLFFFTSHYLFHKIPFIYRNVHKKHHRFQAPVGAASIYAHPIESIVCNLFPAIVGPFVAGTHIIVFWAWISIATINTVLSHSGYAFWNQDHDIHHEKFAYNYGIGLFDRLFGTYK